MRNSPSRARDAIKNGKGKKTIVVCVPALDARVGLPFMGPGSMSAAATLRAVDVLRREVRVAASTGGAEGMNDIEVVSLEVGTLDIPPFAGRRLLDYDPKEYTKSWTPSEKLAYGPAWELTQEGQCREHSKRKAQKVELFVCDLVQIVSRGRVCSVSLCGLRLHIGPVFDWFRGGRYAVGSGGNCRCPHLGRVYCLADICIYTFSTAVMNSIVSHLPGVLLDFIINIPYFLLSTHKALTRNRATASTSPAAPEPPPPPPLPLQPAPRPVPTRPEAPVTVAKENTDSAPSSEHEHETSENGSEADVESNDGAGVGESWISLRPDSSTTSSESTTA
jgi:hypothetical protein